VVTNKSVLSGGAEGFWRNGSVRI